MARSTTSVGSDADLMSNLPGPMWPNPEEICLLPCTSKYLCIHVSTGGRAQSGTDFFFMRAKLGVHLLVPDVMLMNNHPDFIYPFISPQSGLAPQL